MLPSSPQVRTVYSEPAGIIPALKSLPIPLAKETLCIDSTTLDVGVARSVAREVNDSGAKMVDAPVSGGIFFRFGPEIFFNQSSWQVSPEKKLVHSLSWLAVMNLHSICPNRSLNKWGNASFTVVIPVQDLEPRFAIT